MKSWLENALFRFGFAIREDIEGLPVVGLGRRSTRVDRKRKARTCSLYEEESFQWDQSNDEWHSMSVTFHEMSTYETHKKILQVCQTEGDNLYITYDRTHSVLVQTWNTQGTICINTTLYKSRYGAYMRKRKLLALYEEHLRSLLHL